MNVIEAKTIIKQPSQNAEIYENTIQWIKDAFPHTVSPRRNDDKGQEIYDWMVECIGPIDENWTILNMQVRFKTEEDYAMYILTWQG